MKIIAAYNAIVACVSQKRRTTPVFKGRLFDYGFREREDFEELDGPHHSIDELLSYILYEAFEDPVFADTMKCSEEMIEQINNCRKRSIQNST